MLKSTWWKALHERGSFNLTVAQRGLRWYWSNILFSFLNFASQKERVLLKPLRVRAWASRQQFYSRCVESASKIVVVIIGRCRLRRENLQSVFHERIFALMPSCDCRPVWSNLPNVCLASRTIFFFLGSLQSRQGPKIQPICPCIIYYTVFVFILYNTSLYFSIQRSS